MGIFRTKPIGEEQPSGLKRALGPGALIGLGIGAIIGTGIFVLTGVAAAEHAGPGLMLAFVFAGIACAFAALCYAEFAAMRIAPKLNRIRLNMLRISKSQISNWKATFISSANDTASHK